MLIHTDCQDLPLEDFDNNEIKEPDATNGAQSGEEGVREQPEDDEMKNIIVQNEGTGRGDGLVGESESNESHVSAPQTTAQTQRGSSTVEAWIQEAEVEGESQW